LAGADLTAVAKNLATPLSLAARGCKASDVRLRAVLFEAELQKRRDAKAATQAEVKRMRAEALQAKLAGHGVRGEAPHPQEGGFSEAGLVALPASPAGSLLSLPATAKGHSRTPTSLPAI